MKNDQIKKRLVVAGLIVGMVVITAPGFAKKKYKKHKADTTFEKVEKSQQEKRLEVVLELGLTEVSISACDLGEIVRFKALYPEIIGDPEYHFKSKKGVAMLNIETPDTDYDDKDRIENSEYSIQLGTEPELDLSVAIGLGECTMDLTNLKPTEFELETGLGECDVVMSTKNEVRCSKASIECGLGEVSTDHFGNIKFDKLDVEGGLGSIELDLRGYEGDGRVDVSIGLGSCVIIVSRDVGVELFYEDGFFSSVDHRGFKKKSSGHWISKGYEDKKSTLVMDLSVGMGDIDIKWRD